MKDALDLVNRGLSLDDNGNQRTLDGCTQANIEMLEVVKSELEKLLTQK